MTGQEWANLYPSKPPRKLTAVYTAACPGCGLDATWTASTLDIKDVPVAHVIDCGECA